MRPELYTRPDKPLRIPVTKRERVSAPATAEKPAAPLIVDKATECHVTPDDVAARMVEYLEPLRNRVVLEPSAGTGSLIQALIDAEQSPSNIVAVERHIGLYNALRERFPLVASGCGGCFLDYAERWAGEVTFPRIIMNPPFSKVRKHIAAAVSLLGHGGHPEAPRLVALVPVTFQHEDAETLETLPADTFSTAKVHTKIIRIFAG